MERERKFLVAGKAIIDGLPGTRFVQGYLVVASNVEVRIRTGPAGQILTVKGQRNGRDRYEKQLIIEDRDVAYSLVEQCDGLVVVKTRYINTIRLEDGIVETWTIDKYHGDNEGLVIAEFEYPQERLDREPSSPWWLGREVTNESRFYAAQLSVYPYRRWTDEERAGI